LRSFFRSQIWGDIRWSAVNRLAPTPDHTCNQNQAMSKDHWQPRLGTPLPDALYLKTQVDKYANIDVWGDSVIF